LYLVAHGVSQREEPLAAAVAMVPPLSLDTSLIAPVVEITTPFFGCPAERRTRSNFPAEAELMDVSFPTIGTP